ncbi:MAG: peptidoglycan DD-metalloendopeptidase family protein [Leptospiraceae bacterium]|nr:peptidoglycan DD-metalloendopeptidase family protein [Leptospiraceae bacterium]
MKKNFSSSHWLGPMQKLTLFLTVCCFSLAIQAEIFTYQIQKNAKLDVPITKMNAEAQEKQQPKPEPVKIEVKPEEQNRAVVPYPKPKLKPQFERPIDGKLQVEKDFSDITYDPHNGTVLKTSDGKVVSSKEGKVLSIDNLQGYQKVIVLEHSEGYYSIYGYMDNIAVEEGQFIKKGKLLGTVGKDKNLYFQVSQGSSVKPVNPLKLLQ